MPALPRLDVSDAVRLEQVDALGLGLSVQLARPLPCRGVTPLGLVALDAAAVALRDWVDRECLGATAIADRSELRTVGVCDAFAGPAAHFVEVGAERLAGIALATAVQAVRRTDGAAAPAVAQLANASFPDASGARSGPARIEATAELVLPFVVVVDRDVAQAVRDALDGAEVDPEGPLFEALARACAAAGGITRATVFAPDGDDEAAADDDAAIGEGLPDEDLTFVLIAEEQGRRLEAAQGARALHDVETLPQHVRRLQALCARENEAQFAYSQSVVLAVTADTVYVGFKTIDDLGRRALQDADPDELSAEALGARWCDWYLNDYHAVVHTLEAAELKLVVFPQMEWERRFLEPPRGDRPSQQALAALPTLDEVLVEESDHEIDPDATAELVLSRLCVCGESDEPADAEADGSVRIVCAAVRTLDRRGRGVHQHNLYATRPAGLARLGEYIEQFMRFPTLPMHGTIDGLSLCDEHLRLAVPVPTGPIRVVDGDDEDDDEELPDLQAMREPQDDGGLLN